MTTVPRVILLVIDSLGVGALPDAGAYGDAGSNTVGNIARAVPLEVPTLRALGLPRVVEIGGHAPAPIGAYGRMIEASPGKDSVTGHWEIAGLVLDRPFPTFPAGFPADVIGEFERRAGCRILGNVAASGTDILDRLGAEHLRTGRPILYTSADSVCQIAAHHDVLAVEALYDLCGIAFQVFVHGLGLARVIARPFTGAPGRFIRTPRRRDFSVTPPGPTLFDRLHEAGIAVVAVGKTGDLFAGRGIARTVPTTSDEQGMDALEAELAQTPSGLLAVTLVDSDTKYGHRNDVAGYAANLERVDARLARLLERLGPSDVLVVTADHGNDPTTPSTDHSREYVPLFLAGGSIRPAAPLGTRTTFADVGQSVAALFGVPALPHGASFLAGIGR